MTKKLLHIALVAALSVALCACGGGETPIDLPKTIFAVEGKLAFRVPENWSADYSDNEDALVLTMTDGVSAYAQVYYYGCDGNYTTLDDFLEEYQEFYGDSMQEEAVALTVGGQNAKKFEYIYEDYNENFQEARFRGFIYLVEAPAGVVCVDIYHLVVEPFTDEVCTKEQRTLLEQIAQSLQFTDADVSPEPADNNQPTPETGATE